MTNRPLVSICIPSYNAAQYIEKTLESIINQSYRNIEIIISDNASTDNTENITQLFSDSRIKYFRNDIHLETAEENYNVAINKSSGELIAVYHSDDVYDENIVFYETEFLNNNPNCAAVFTMGDKIDENGNFINNIYSHSKFRKGGVFYFYDIFMALLRYGYTPLVCSSVMLRRSALEIVGMFNSKKYGTAADTEMWFRIQKKFPIGIISKNLVHYRISKSQVSKKYNYLRTSEADFLRVAEDYINSNSFTEKQRFNLETWLIYQRGIDNIHRSIVFYLNKEYNLASELIKKSLGPTFFFKSFKTLRGIKYLTVAITIYITISLRIHFFTFRIMNHFYNRRWT